MELDNLKALSAIRLEHADECISAAKSLLQSENYKSAANRAYYTVFHAMRAVLAFDKIDMKHHSGIIAEFRRLYIKTGVFDVELSKIISVLSDSRNDSDYDDFFIVSKEEVTEEIKCAELFLNAIKEYLHTK
ncbi:MAG: HEPN domain-containing protein [Clostridia bacterium]|nr:HEPN domain-containing protein [Clostridia bacterium]